MRRIIFATLAAGLASGTALAQSGAVTDMLLAQSTGTSGETDLLSTQPDRKDSPDVTGDDQREVTGGTEMDQTTGGGTMGSQSGSPANLNNESTSGDANTNVMPRTGTGSTAGETTAPDASSTGSENRAGQGEGGASSSGGGSGGASGGGSSAN